MSNHDPPSGGDEQSGSDAAAVHENTEYLKQEVNILRPSTPFMRDHLRLIWTGLFAWILVVFGPVTLTYFFPELMTETTVIGFPLHYMLVAIGAPGGALVLSILFSWRRDKLDAKYGIDHATDSVEDRRATAADGGSDPK